VKFTQKLLKSVRRSKEMNKVRDIQMNRVSNLYEEYQDDIDDYYSVIF